MDTSRYNVFVPCYPVLMRDAWEGYRTGLPVTALYTRDIDFWQNLEIEQPLVKMETEKPDTKDCYEMKGVYYSNYDIRDWTGLWHVFPEDWEKSYSAVFSALNNLLTYMNPGEKAIALAEEAQNLALALYRHIVYGEALPEK